jgi:hypothetical protein
VVVFTILKGLRETDIQPEGWKILSLTSDASVMTFDKGSITVGFFAKANGCARRQIRAYLN